MKEEGSWMALKEEDEEEREKGEGNVASKEWVDMEGSAMEEEWER